MGIPAVLCTGRRVNIATEEESRTMTYEDRDSTGRRTKQMARPRFMTRSVCGGAALCSLALLWAASSGATPPDQPATSPPASDRAAPAAKAQKLDRATVAKPDANVAKQRPHHPGRGPQDRPPGAAVGSSPALPPSAASPAEAASARPLLKAPQPSLAGQEVRQQAMAAYRAALRAKREAAAEGKDRNVALEKLEEARAQLLEAHERTRSARSPLPEAKLKARNQKLAELLEKARSDRNQRRGERVAQLKKTYGATLDAPAVRSELLLHAWRVARLERLMQMAEAEERSELLTRAKELLAKETARHEAELAKLAKETGAKSGEAPKPKADDTPKPKSGEAPNPKPGDAPTPKAEPAQEGAQQ